MKNLKLISSQKLSSSEVAAIRQAYRINQKYFMFWLPKLTVIVCHNAHEWRKNSKYYYYEFARGLVLRDGTVILKSKKLANKNIRAWSKIVTHEINHSYWCYLRKNLKSRRDLWSPIWLVEGLACHVAKNDIISTPTRLKSILENQPYKPALPYRYSASLFRNADEVTNRYTAWTYFVSFLLENGLSKKELISLITLKGDRPYFLKTFKKLFGQDLESAYGSFVSYSLNNYRTSKR